MNLLAFGVPLFPQANSDHASDIDLLYGYLNLVTIFFSVLIFALVIYFSVRYRRKSNDERPAEIHGNNFLEILWSVVPFLMTLVMFFWGTKLHFNQAYPPADAMEIMVTGKQWMWKVQHPNGKREINDLHVPVGVPVKLTITSEDVIHSYYIPSMRLKRDAVPGKYTTMWFEANEIGEFYIFCAEYCGTEHSKMGGKIHVVTQAEYNDWLDTAGTSMDAGIDLDSLSPVDRGKALYSMQIGGSACSTCHLTVPGARLIGPSFADIYGRPGTFMPPVEPIERKDENYIRESILYPNKKIVFTYPPGQMLPIYQQALNDKDVEGLIAYIKSLAPEDVK